MNLSPEAIPSSDRERVVERLRYLEDDLRAFRDAKASEAREPTRSLADVLKDIQDSEKAQSR